MSTVSPTGVHRIDLASPELDAIRQVVDHYADGLRNGSVESLQKAFHPQAVMSGYFNDDLMLMDMEGFHGLTRSIDPPAETGEPFRHEITDVRVTGNTATVEIAEYHFLGHNFRTCFQMIRIDGRWQIVAKIFSTLGPAAG